MTNPDVRASDADRERAVAALQRHTADGRLTLDEFGERVSRALAAATHGELADLIRDLPADLPAAEQALGAPAFHSHQLVVAFLLAALALAVIGVLLAVGR